MMLMSVTCQHRGVSLTVDVLPDVMYQILEVNTVQYYNTVIFQHHTSTAGFISSHLHICICLRALSVHPAGGTSGTLQKFDH